MKILRHLEPIGVDNYRALLSSNDKTDINITLCNDMSLMRLFQNVRSFIF